MSTDGGESWAFVGGPPTIDEISGATQLADGRSVLLGAGRVWWTEDGLSWTEQALDHVLWTELAPRGAELVVAGRGGIAVLEPSGALALEHETEVRSLLPGPGGLSAVDPWGEVWIDEGGSWTSAGLPDPRTSVAIRTEDAVFAGTLDGEVLRWAGEEWTPCGPFPTSDAPPEIVRMAATDDAVLVAQGGRGPVATYDGCATWVRLNGQQVSFEGAGSADDAQEAWAVLMASEARIVAGGWSGLARSVDMGESWSDAPILPADYTRGLAFSPAFATDHMLWVGSYMGGVLRSIDAGGRFFGPNRGLSYPNVQDVRVHPGAPELLYAIVNHDPQVSRDGGINWQAVPSPFTISRSLWPTQAGLWTLGFGPDGDGLLFRAWDQDAWTQVLTLKDSGQLGIVELDGQETACVSIMTLGQLLCIRADEDSPRILLEDEIEIMTQAVASASGTLWVGLGARILRSDDGGGTWGTELDLGADRVFALELASDGRLLLGTRTGALWVGDGDGGWTAVEARLPAAPNIIVARPDFAAFPQAVIGTHAGLFVLDADTGTLAPFATVQWIDDASGYVCSSCETVVDPRASFGGVFELLPGLSTRTPVRGSSLGVRGHLDEGARLQVIVRDSTGAEVASRSAVGPTQGIADLVAIEGLPEAWYELVLNGEEGVYIDVVVGLGSSEPLAVAPAGGKEGCGGSSGGCAAVPEGSAQVPFAPGIGLALAGLLIQRRRRASAATLRPPTPGAGPGRRPG